MEKLKLKINYLLFWWYYKRVPEFFHQWPILKSISLLRQNYEHQAFIIKGKDEVLSNASKRELEMRSRISELEMKQAGISQEYIDQFNRVFGTGLKGLSNEERYN